MTDTLQWPDPDIHGWMLVAGERRPFHVGCPKCAAQMDKP